MDRPGLQGDSDMEIAQNTGSEVRAQSGQFYESVGYSGKVKDSDIVISARENNEIAGLVRLCEEEGVLVLRGLYVAEKMRGIGIGKRLLQAGVESIGKKDCWGIPFRSLMSFYSSAGFSEHSDADAPSFLVQRRDEYRSRGLDVVIAKRERSHSE